MISKVGLPTFRSFFSLLKLERKKTLSTNLDLASFQKIFNSRFGQYLDEKVASYTTITTHPLALETLTHAVSLMRTGGKRVRPYMLFLAYCTDGGFDEEEAVRVSIALELFHGFALIHDDLIDRGMERHGMPTTHEYVQKLIANEARGDKRHIAEGLALLAGDIIFSWAHEVIASAKNERVQKIFFTMIEEVMAGQMLDVSFMLQNKVESALILRKNELKTALYSFVNPMCIGAALVGTEAHNALYRELGLLLGQAFQIQDDLLDIVGDPQKTGKIGFIDIQDGQHTLISQFIFERGKVQEREILMSLFGKPIDDHSRKVLSRLFVSTGAIAYAEREIIDLLARAKILIAHSRMRNVDALRWSTFITLLEARKH